MNTKLITLFLIMSKVVAFAVDPPSPTLVPFQGRLTNQQGQAYNSGQYTLTFNIYSQAVGGTSSWTERHEKVGVVNGMVNVFLGSISGLASVDFSTTKYLGITIDADNNSATADPEMVPRQMMIPAFHAKNAENAVKLAGRDWSAFVVDGTNAATNDPVSGFLSGAKIAIGSITASRLATNAVTTDKIQDGTVTVEDLSTALRQASVIPPGTIMAFAGKKAQVPAGWLLCDGSALKSTVATYSALYSSISTNWGNGTTSPTGVAFPAVASGPAQTDFNIPDLRGQFLRGNDGGVGRDPDRASRTAMAAGGNVGDNVGSVQPDAFQQHIHTLAQGDAQFTAGGPNSVKSIYGYGTINAQYAFGTGDRTSSEGGSLNETRPKNANVNYIIKL